MKTATFTLVEGPCADRRTVSVDSVPVALEQIAERTARWPQAAAVCDDVLRTVKPDGPTLPGVFAESLAYSTLQAGPEFARWLAERGPATVPVLPDPVVVERTRDDLLVRFNRPTRHNAFSTDARAALLEALDGDLALQLNTHLTGREVDALRARTAALLQNPVMPGPDRRRPIPWPAF
jgi:hypothetical protein